MYVLIVRACSSTLHSWPATAKTAAAKCIVQPTVLLYCEVTDLPIGTLCENYCFGMYTPHMQHIQYPISAIYTKEFVSVLDLEHSITTFERIQPWFQTIHV